MIYMAFSDNDHNDDNSNNFISSPCEQTSEAGSDSDSSLSRLDKKIVMKFTKTMTMIMIMTMMMIMIKTMMMMMIFMIIFQPGRRVRGNPNIFNNKGESDSSKGENLDHHILSRLLLNTTMIIIFDYR